MTIPMLTVRSKAASGQHRIEIPAESRVCGECGTLVPGPLGRRLVELREAADPNSEEGLTRADLRQRGAPTIGTQSKLELGKVGMGPAALLDYARAYGVGAEHLRAYLTGNVPLETFVRLVKIP